MEETCIFCDIVSGKIASKKVFENDNFLVVHDAFPKLKNHLLVLPKEHSWDFVSMDKNLDSELLGVVREVVVQEGFRDFNLVTNRGASAGQVVFHTHFHILPRKEGDGFKFGI